MANTVKYGLKNVYYAKATLGTTGAYTYSAPVAWPGAVNLSLDAEGEVTKFRADNVDYWVGQSNNGYSGSLESALVPDSFKKDILGYFEDAGGMLVEDAAAPATPFALMFQFEGDDKATRHVMYRCTASRPSVSGQTTDASIEPQTESVDITASSIPVIGKDVVKASALESSPNYSTWFTAVQLPTAST